ncbi:hypothetical protein [Aureimonas populi]|uniref:Uncharacterized protein n=1 Tax=Aureimonas populi TaxID=1701758 RepID=A0ABW5CK04_9HYPH|nr:hypothetical protein [Aureimonas populi]
MRLIRTASLSAITAVAHLSPAAVPSVLAFSQISGENGGTRSLDGILSVPLPPLPGEESPAEPDVAPGEPDSAEAAAPDTAPLPVRYGDEGLSAPARDLRQRLIEIARAGEIEALRPYLETGSRPTALSVVPVDEDPVAFLKRASGDGEGVEILAILLEVLLSGHVRMDPGGENEIYVWPYFTQVPLEELTNPQLVELFEIVTAGDYQNMVANGAYDFYRVGISPEGRLEFFLAGD